MARIENQQVTTRKELLTELKMILSSYQSKLPEKVTKGEMHKDIALSKIRRINALITLLEAVDIDNIESLTMFLAGKAQQATLATQGKLDF